MSLTDEISQALDNMSGLDALADISDQKPPTRKKRARKVPDPPKHLVIPDTQCGPGTPTVHLEWIGQYIVDAFAGDDLTIIHLGDHWDMPSLSSYDRGKAGMEGRRVARDIEAGNRGFDLLNAPLHRYNAEHPRKPWWPRRVFLMGNHEDRITRAVEEHAQLEGLLSLDLLNAKRWGWEVHDFLEVVTIGGVSYSHYFYNPLSGRPYAGLNVETRLKTIGHSFTMGHQQVLLYGVRAITTGLQHGLVAGSAYLHDEEYRGPQGNAEWRGIVLCNQVENGSYDPAFLSLDFLCRRFEGKRLTEFLEAGC